MQTSAARRASLATSPQAFMSRMPNAKTGAEYQRARQPEQGPLAAPWPS